MDTDGFGLLVLNAFEVAEIGVDVERCTDFLSGFDEVLVFICSNHADGDLGICGFPEGDDVGGDECEECNDSDRQDNPVVSLRDLYDLTLRRAKGPSSCLFAMITINSGDVVQLF